MLVPKTRFIISWVVLALSWDFYFFLAHRAFHLNKTLYRMFHKTHHTYKAGRFTSSSDAKQTCLHDLPSG